MGNWSKTVVARYINVGTALFLMGFLWLYLWVVHWYDAYVYDPRWGHNYAEALAFMAVGLAYFNRRFISDVLALLASLLILPASLELLPHSTTAIMGGVIAGLLIIDMVVERNREQDLGQPSNRRFFVWAKRHFPRFSLTMLLHLTFIYYLVRLPGGTYETDLVTKVYDLMLIPFILLALLEGPVPKLWGVPTARAGFFWGMLTMLVSLILLDKDLGVWITMGVTIIVTLVAVVALLRRPEPAAEGG